MGIKNLMKLLDEEAPASYKQAEKKNYFGRTVAIDASMQLYQFLVQVRTQGESGRAQMLMNEEGDVTSHLQGFFNRTAGLLEAGIKPVFVFDGKPPTLKGGELAKRREKKRQAEEELREAAERAKEAEDEEAAQAAIEEMNKADKKSIHVTKEQNEDVKKLLRLMGIPVVEAPCEAEAQCAELNKKGKVWASATEDMDCLTFATPVLLRRLTRPDTAKEPVLEIHYAKLLGPDGLNLTPAQFVDLCILCGCDYCDSIRGIGSKTALKLIREHGSLEEVLKHVDRAKHFVPEALDNPESLQEIRALFTDPEVTPGDTVDVSFSAPDKEGLKEFLVKEKNFNEERVAKVIERLVKARTGGNQMRLDDFFKPAGGSSSSSSSSSAVGFKKSAVPAGKDGKKRPGGGAVGPNKKGR